VDGPCEKWKPDLKVIKAMIQFVMKTGRFQPKATVAEAESEDEEDRDEAGMEQDIEGSDDHVGSSL
jgi:hypothetical protein